MTRHCLLCIILGGVMVMIFGAALEFLLRLAHMPYALAWAAFATGAAWGYWTRFMQTEYADD